MKAKTADDLEGRFGFSSKPVIILNNDVASEASIRRVSRLIDEVLKSPWWQTRLLAFGDVIIASLSVASGFWFTPYYGVEVSEKSHLSLEYCVVIFAAGYVLTSFAAGLYERKYVHSSVSVALAAPFAAAGAWVVLMLFNYFLTYVPIGRWIVVLSWANLSVACVLSRMLFRVVLGDSSTSILLIGDEQGSQLLTTAAKGLGDPSTRVAATVPLGGSSFVPKALDLRQLVRLTKADVVVVQDGCQPALLEQAVDCVRDGTWVTDFVWYFENTFNKVPVEKINLSWLISAHLNLIRPLGVAIKRGTDLLLSFVGLIITAPLWPVIALLIKATSRGPVFYTQERVGLHGQSFTLIKFRTMCDGAENGKAVWAKEHDDRVTAVGRFLRRSRLDEIPQFLNVLKGDMAFVGPRPERPNFVAFLSKKLPHYNLRHLVKPGITGWAQIMYPYGASESDALEKLRYDLFYAKHGNLTLDLRILVRTVGAMMKGSR